MKLKIGNKRKSMKQKGGSLKKVNKIDKPLARLTKIKKRERTQSPISGMKQRLS